MRNRDLDEDYTIVRSMSARSLKREHTAAAAAAADTQNTRANASHGSDAVK